MVLRLIHYSIQIGIRNGGEITLGSRKDGVKIVQQQLFIVYGKGFHLLDSMSVTGAIVSRLGRHHQHDVWLCAGFCCQGKRFFKREGLVPEIVVMSRNEQIVQALISDSLQFSNVPPNLLLTLRQQGMIEIKLIAGSFGVREGWAQKNRGVVIGYLKALVSTYQWLHDNREEAIQLLTRITKLDKKYIPKSWETYTKTQIWPRTGEVNLKGVQTLARLMEEEGALKKPSPNPKRSSIQLTSKKPEELWHIKGNVFWEGQWRSSNHWQMR